MDSSERRRDLRAHASPPLHIVRIGSVEKVEVLNVSYRGLFVRMDEPPQLNELLKVRVELPGKKVINAHVVSVRIVPDAQGRAGVGVRFFALVGEEKRAWESYITSLVSPRRAAA
ncbi:MAG: PilZ domain-containing protein [Labilithrix sp.]|nr:PilZ domain-containing protein [Labilithrix sp.]MCW5810946.1 PilZ domain-containing protein [Labilithrix sp.]